MFIAALMTFLVMTEGFSADAAAAKLSTPKMTAQINYGSDFTHPYNKQTNTIKVHWSKVSGASGYELYIKGGKYKSWKNTRQSRIRTALLQVFRERLLISSE